MSTRIRRLSAVPRSLVRRLSKGFQFSSEAAKELHLVRSARDLGALLEKWRYLYPRLSNRHLERTALPPSLQLEPTNYCNLRCVSCSTSTSKRVRGHMDYALFTRIIDEASELGVRRVHLYLHGEPMIHPRITDMVRYIKKQGMAVNMTTNGMLLGSERIAQLLQCGLTLSDHVTISMLGNSPEVHERVMRGVSRAKVVDSVQELVRMRNAVRKSGPIVETMFYSMPENSHEKEAYRAFWRGKVDHVRVGGTVSESFRSVGRTEPAIPARTSSCSLLWERMTVYWNGEVTVCCEDVNGTQIVGDIRRSTIPEIWNCKKLTAIRDIHRRGAYSEFPFCNTCDM